MPVVLVVVDAVDGSAPKPTLELLTLARRIGSPAAVVFGPDAGQVVPVLATTRRPARSAGQLVKDDGDGGRALADFLAAQRFI